MFLLRIKAEKGAKKDGEIFDAKKEEYQPSEQRKKDQSAVDTQVNIKIFYQVILNLDEKQLCLI